MKIVSMAQKVPGPAAVARLVAGGAVAIKIEAPWGDPLEGLCQSWYDELHAGVTVARLDLKTADGMRSLMDLLGSADVFIASHRPAALERLIGRKVVTAGVPGEVSAEGLERLPNLLDESKPALLLLCHGGNDFPRKLGEAAAAGNVPALSRPRPPIRPPGRPKSGRRRNRFSLKVKPSSIEPGRRPIGATAECEGRPVRTLTKVPV